MIKRNTKAGFSLFEMLISVAIITIIAGIAFYNHTKFNSDIEITNLAYRMALMVRQAQVYSVSVRQFDQSFDVSYGLHFKKSHPNMFVLYADADADGLYTQQLADSRDFPCSKEADSECVEQMSIGRGNAIKGWCGFLYATDPECIYLDDGDSEPQFLDIQFKRPDPDAIFRLYKDDYDASGENVLSACDAGRNDQCSGWAICLVSPEGREKRVVVYQSGQISVENVMPNTPCYTS